MSTALSDDESAGRTGTASMAYYLMGGKPKRILRTNLAAKSLQRMEEYQITSLFVFESEEDQKPIGIIHLHDLLKAGVI